MSYNNAHIIYTIMFYMLFLTSKHIVPNSQQSWLAPYLIGRKSHPSLVCVIHSLLPFGQLSIIDNLSTIRSCKSFPLWRSVCLCGDGVTTNPGSYGNSMLQHTNIIVWGLLHSSLMNISLKALQLQCTISMLESSQPVANSN